MDLVVNAFDPESIAKAISELKKATGHLVDDELMIKVAERAVEITKEEIIASGAVGFTGELLDSVHYEYDQNNKVITLIVAAEHALYVEFGTGVVGESRPHPKASEQGYQYNVKGRAPGEKWSYWKGDNWYSTEGQEPRMFFLKAEERIREYLESLSVK